jgi:PhnB protein
MAASGATAPSRLLLAEPAQGKDSIMAKKVAPIPPGYHTVTPYLAIRKAARAIDFYKKAFGAAESYRLEAPDGSIAHAEIRIGDSPVMLSDENPEMGSKSPQTLGGTPANLLLYVEDVDAAFRRAVAAGATATMPPADMFWGDRYGKLLDPFGHEWSLATHIEDLTPAQIAERARSAFAPE